MDLHTTADQASHTERAAVDSVLGAATSAWQGGTRDFSNDGRVAAPPSAGRDQLLPALHAVQARIGWISPGVVNYIAQRLNVAPAEIHGVASFYAMFSLSQRPKVVAHVCDDVACLARGAQQVCSDLATRLGPPLSHDDSHRSKSQTVAWLRSPCLGLCDRAPAALITASGEASNEFVLDAATAEAIEAAARDATEAQAPTSRPLSQHPVCASNAPDSASLLRRVDKLDPLSISQYQRHGGYAALRRALEIGPERVVQEVLDSRILGRGGAAFPVGKKWEALARQRKTGATHYVVCNADESEPGTFKDRVLMEGDPFAILEGMTIAAFATEAQRGFIYVRGEYPKAAAILSHAINAARSAGLLGESILGADFRFDIELRRGAGAYICGEETALFNSIEGYRGEPRNKPPFPTQSGLFRQPTVVNNVETLANIPEVVLKGGAAYAQIGTPQSTGYRLFCISGNVRQPGVYEVPFGTTLRRLLELAGGVGGSGRLQSVLLGGAAGTFLSPGEIDLPLSFEGVRAANATLGSGAVIVFDDSVDMKQILARIARFFTEETCGQCVPCRVGTMRQAEILERLAAHEPLQSVSQELQMLNEVGQAMRDASICGLGQTASSAILSAISRWSLYS
ncbi:MAG TPA: NAD(P)H-dependent oxidoreductase subunit E [Candidatus Acidoferrales bacterium]|nr:NAD(P)H-dependent oxidoreductase subunit E [Candidatus Acidoferrales bacterium]